MDTLTYSNYIKEKIIENFLLKRKKYSTDILKKAERCNTIILNKNSANGKNIQ